VVCYDVSGNALWARRAGGTENDEAPDVVSHADGSVTVAGVFGYTADFGAIRLTGLGDYDIFLARLFKSP
jgi:hypothetical protein